MKKERLNNIDNAKGILIILVVFGHILERYTMSNDSVFMLRQMIYLFHMPAFIFLSGLFVKSFVNKDKFDLRKILDFVFLYIFMEIIMYVLKKYLFGYENVQFNPTTESAIPWFLMCMVIWKTITFVLKEIKFEILFPISILVSVFVGFFDNVNDTFALSRMFVFYPFFLAGYYLDIKKLTEWIKNKYVKALSVLGAAFIFLIVYFKIDYISGYVALLSGRNPYSLLEMEWHGVIARILIMIANVIIITALLVISTNVKSFITYIGANTLQIYFFHEFILMIIANYKIDGYFKNWFGDYWFYAFALLTIPIVSILSMQIFAKITDFLSMKKLTEKILK